MYVYVHFPKPNTLCINLYKYLQMGRVYETIAMG